MADTIPAGKYLTIEELLPRLKLDDTADQEVKDFLSRLILAAETRLAAKIKALGRGCRLDVIANRSDEDLAAVKEALIDSVARVYRMPDWAAGFSGESEGDYNYNLNPQEAAANLWFRNDDLDTLCPPRPKVGTIRLHTLRHPRRPW